MNGYIKGMIERHMGEDARGLTSYRAGSLAGLPEYERADALYSGNRTYVESSVEQVKAGLFHMESCAGGRSRETAGAGILGGNLPGSGVVAAKGVALGGKAEKEAGLNAGIFWQMDELRAQAGGKGKIGNATENISGMVKHTIQTVIEQIRECNIQENDGLGEPTIMNDWLILYDKQTVLSDGFMVLAHPNGKKYDWGMPEELKGARGLERGMLPSNSRSIIEAAGGTPVVNIINNNLYTDAEGRYWVAVGPNVMNPDHGADEEITLDEMQYGTKIDIVVLDKKTGNEYYIPAVVGDVKAHTAPDGIYQTGFGFPGNEDAPEHNDGSTIEFIGWEIEDSSVNLTNEYKISGIIVYEGVTNY